MTDRVEEFVYEATADEAADALHRLTAFMCEWSDERIAAIGLALGAEGLDVARHQRACSIERSLDALRATALALYYLLPQKKMMTGCTATATAAKREAKARPLVTCAAREGQRG